MEQKHLADRLVVYTVLVGQRAELNNTPESSSVDFVCLTDQQDLESNGWEVRKIDSMWPDDFPKSSRHPKINPHLYFSEYSRSIYVDSSVQLTADPEQLWSKLVHSNEVVFGGIQHSFHLNMLEELSSVSHLGFEANAVLKTQLKFSIATFPEYLSCRPTWGGILARRHNQSDCISAMKVWFSILTEHSKRDQLSLPLALRSIRGTQFQLSFLDNRESQYHQWPVGGYVKSQDYIKSNPESLGLGVLDPLGVDPLPINSFHAHAERDAIIAERDAIIAERDAILKTKLWRWTKGIRQLVSGSKFSTRSKLKKEKKSAYKALQSNHPEPGNTIQSKIFYKMAWDRNPKIRIYADKWLVRKYIRDKVGEEYLVPLLGVYRRPSAIDYANLPEEFVLKVNHGSGGVIVVSNSAPEENRLPIDINSVGWQRFQVQPENFSPDIAEKLLNRWIKMDYEWWLGRNPEWAYKNIKRRILVEELMVSKGDSGLTEFKIYCFDGNPQIIVKQAGSVSEKSNAYYHANWQWIEASYLEKGTPWSKIQPEDPPKNLEKLIKISKKLSIETDFIRVDFIEDGFGSLRVGELTNYPTSGQMEYTPKDYALLLGKDWNPSYR